MEGEALRIYSTHETGTNIEILAVAMERDFERKNAYFNFHAKFLTQSPLILFWKYSFLTKIQDGRRHCVQFHCATGMNCDNIVYLRTKVGSNIY